MVEGARMKVGDLVQWSDTSIAWHLAKGYPVQDFLHHRQRGIIFSENKKYVFVYWGDGERMAEERDWLEVVSESR